MDAFRWEACFVTGLPDVDDQHHRLVDLINRFGDMVMRDEGASTVELETVFGELADYAEYHFTEEEAMMHAVGLDPQYVLQHHQSHTSFLEEVSLLHSSVSADNRDAAKSLLQFLTHWLAHHILGSDQFMARQIEQVKAGFPAVDGHPAEVLSSDRATAALLTALNGLFQQVSERNRDLMVLNKTLESRVAERTRALSEANQRLEELANTDVLTNLPNRRYALRTLASEWGVAGREDTPLSCMVIDADGFKVVNDSHGHAAGDLVLRTLAARLVHAVRTDDVVCRLGGDEFLIICARTPLAGALQLAEVIRHDVAALCVPLGSSEWRGSISVGVATRSSAMTGLEDLLKAADEGVYAAKHRGRNCVVTVDL